MKKFLILLVSAFYANQLMSTATIYQDPGTNTTIMAVDCNESSGNYGFSGYKIRRWEWARYKDTNKPIYIAGKKGRTGYPVLIDVYSKNIITDANKNETCSALCEQFNTEHATNLFKSDRQIATSSSKKRVWYSSKTDLANILGEGGVNDFEWTGESGKKGSSKNNPCVTSYCSCISKKHSK